MLTTPEKIIFFVLSLAALYFAIVSIRANCPPDWARPGECRLEDRPQAAHRDPGEGDQHAADVSNPPGAQHLTRLHCLGFHLLFAGQPDRCSRRFLPQLSILQPGQPQWDLPPDSRFALRGSPDCHGSSSWSGDLSSRRRSCAPALRYFSTRPLAAVSCVTQPSSAVLS